jgi:translation initiation factor IF-2
MAKKRIHEFAKELGLASRLILAKCEELGISAKSHSSTVEEEQQHRIVVSLGLKPPAAPAVPPPAPPPASIPSPARPSKPSGREPPRPASVSEPAPAVPPGGPDGAATGKRAVFAPSYRRDEETGITVHEIAETGTYGEAVRHVRLEKSKVRARMRPRKEERRRRPAEEGRPADGAAAPAAERVFKVSGPVSVKDLSQQLGVKTGVLMRHLMDLGVMATINRALDGAVVGLIAEKMNLKIEVDTPPPLEETALADEEDDPKLLRSRPPVVTFLGHVDHGKTSLLDRIRNTQVAAGEAGGITQHLGAYRLDRPGKGSVVFLDTPGHEAFTAMRARGANVTDVVVLVVAADDGVMPQTEEAFNHARAAEVPVVVAINKVDKPGANVQRVKQQLSTLGLTPEDWGGKTVCMEVSALTGQGVDALFDMLSLEAELLELKANPSRKARGIVLDSHLSEGRGIVAQVLVRNGTLRKGDVVLCGTAHGRVRQMRADTGKNLNEVPPGTPVQITGLSEVPEAGETFYVLEDPQQAKQLADERRLKVREKELLRRQHVTLENLFTHLAQEKVRELRVILKADVKGSLEVIDKSLTDISTGEVRVRVLHRAVGAVTESDVLLADASDAVIVGFQVVAEDNASRAAEGNGVEIRMYHVIYQLIEELKKGLEGMLEPEERERVLGKIQVREVFHSSKLGNIAGCVVTRGIMRRNTRVRLARDGIVIFEGSIASLRRFKEDVREVKEGFECGIRLERFDDVKTGDVIEAYEIEKVARTLDAAKPSS